jgi:hypothetical protein
MHAVLLPVLVNEIDSTEMTYEVNCSIVRSIPSHHNGSILIAFVKLVHVHVTTT